jgi:hypothetical protein
MLLETWHRGVKGLRASPAAGWGPCSSSVKSPGQSERLWQSFLIHSWEFFVGTLTFLNKKIIFILTRILWAYSGSSYIHFIYDPIGIRCAIFIVLSQQEENTGDLTEYSVHLPSGLMEGSLTSRAFPGAWRQHWVKCESWDATDTGMPGLKIQLNSWVTEQRAIYSTKSHHLSCYIDIVNLSDIDFIFGLWKSGVGLTFEL